MYFTTQEGVALMTRYPIIHTDFIQLTRNYSDSDDAHNRICLGAIIDTPAGQISVFTTHFSLSANARKRNIVELYEFMLSFPPPYILTGDLNTEPDSPEIHFLQGSLEWNGIRSNLKDAWNVVKDRMELADQTGWTYTTLSEEPKKRIDYIFYSPGLRLEGFNFNDENQRDETIASDHRLITTSFYLDN